MSTQRPKKRNRTGATDFVPRSDREPSPGPSVSSTTNATRNFNQGVERQRKPKQHSIKHTIISVAGKGNRPGIHTRHALAAASSSGRTPSTLRDSSTTPKQPTDCLNARTAQAANANDIHFDDNSPEWEDEIAQGSEHDAQRMREHLGRKRSKKKKKSRNNPLAELMAIMSIILDTSLKHDGLGERELDAVTKLPACDQCNQAGARHRCRSCLFERILCIPCLLAEHSRLPLHLVERWNDLYWTKNSLSKLGLRIQLGHNGGACPNSDPQNADLVVIDASGIHNVAYSTCCCYDEDHDALAATQMLNVRWWPATASRPATAVTDRACRLFQALTLQGKVNVHDFWNGLVRITDSSGLHVVKRRYSEMGTVMKVFRYHRILKRGGVGHIQRKLVPKSRSDLLPENAVVDGATETAPALTDPSTAALTDPSTASSTVPSSAVNVSAGGSQGTANVPLIPNDAEVVMVESRELPVLAPGALVLRCPSCPNKGNLAPGYQNAPERERYKHALYVSEDGNFKLRRKAKKTTRDVAMGDGLLFFVEEKAYASHLSTHTDETEMKECRSSFTAISSANSSGDERFEINGVGAVVCARHLFYLPQSVADLRFGERYVSMDYALFTMLQIVGVHILTLYITYDIACQFSRNLNSRWEKYKTDFRLDAPGRTVRFAVPKYHLPGHGQDCLEDYNLNNTQGAGRTCGEGIEAGWANTNGAALMTREAGPHSRHFALNDLFQSINWQKTLTLGTWTLKGLESAVVQHARQSKALIELEGAFPKRTVATWLTALRTWEDDFGESPNPFHEEDTGHAYTNIQLELDDEEAHDAASVSTSGGKTQSRWLTEGIDLADQRWFLLRYVKSIGKNPSPVTQKVLAQKRHAYRHKLAQLRALQRVFMPQLFEPLPTSAEPAVTTSQDSAQASQNVTTSEPTADGNDGLLSDKLDVKNPERHDIVMPWELDEDVRARLCTSTLLKKSARLLKGDCRSAMHAIRRGMRAKYNYVNHKRIHVDGAGTGSQSGVTTAAQKAIYRVNDKISRQTQRYIRSRAALLTLDPEGDWKIELRVLDEKTDLRLPTKDQRELGQGFRVVSWIWTTVKPHATDLPGNLDGDMASVPNEVVHESMRVEWTVGRARVDRWIEERELRLEEMRRTLVDLLNRSREWQSQVGSRPAASLALRRGLDARAERQASIYKGIALSFYEMWKPAVDKHGLTVDWPTELTVPIARSYMDLVDSAAIRACMETARADMTDLDRQDDDFDGEGEEAIVAVPQDAQDAQETQDGDELAADESDVDEGDEEDGPIVLVPADDAFDIDG